MEIHWNIVYKALMYVYILLTTVLNHILFTSFKVQVRLRMPINSPSSGR